jgi:DNA-binding response OmpR family regulator
MHTMSRRSSLRRQSPSAPRRSWRLPSARRSALRQVWGHADEAKTRTVDTHAARLWLRLEADHSRLRHILTVRPLGFRRAPRP